MSVINSNAFAGALAPAPTLTEFDADPAPASAVERFAAQRTDDVAASPWAQAAVPAASAGAGGSPAAGAWNYSSVMNDFMAALSRLLGALGSGLGNPGTAPSAPAAPGLPAVPSPAPAPAAPGGSETFFANATAESIGDPHDGFDGTSASGTTAKTRWDDMRAHADLLDSDSFAGGYRISTTVTDPSSNGVTLNKSATIATNGGATSITLNGDGSYAVVSNGRNVSLQRGVTTSLGNGESVTLGVDGSLTVDDQNASGGSIATTLSRNGAGGVDVHTAAKAVDLGGYLVTGSSPAAPVTSPPLPPTPDPVRSDRAVPPWPVPLSNAGASGVPDGYDPFGVEAPL